MYNLFTYMYRLIDLICERPEVQNNVDTPRPHTPFNMEEYNGTTEPRAHDPPLI